MATYNRRVSPKTIEETYTDNDVPHEINEYKVKSYPTYDSSIGFSFDYPMRWLNDKSDYKAIGIRRLKVVPSSHSINFYIKTSTGIRDIIVNKYPYDEDQPTHIYIHDFIYNPVIMDLFEFVKITQQNSLDEVMTYLINAFNNKYGENVQFNYEYIKARFIVPIEEFDEKKPITDYMIEKYCDVTVDVDEETTTSLENRLSLSYSLKNDELRFYFELLHWNYDKYLTIAPDVFDMKEYAYKHYSYVIEDESRFTYVEEGNVFSTTMRAHHCLSEIWLYDENLTDLTINTYLVPLLQFLNQDIHGDLKALTSGDLNKVVFKGVWDREVIQVHASFSDNNNGFIGLGGDFYEKPSVLYEPPTNHSNFNLWFTTNGRNRILLRYCRFFVGLCFIRNYNTSLATK